MSQVSPVMIVSSQFPARSVQELIAIAKDRDIVKVARSPEFNQHLTSEGAIATGATVEEAESELREAIEFHLAGLREDGAPIPQASSRVDYVDVAV